MDDKDTDYVLYQEDTLTEKQEINGKVQQYYDLYPFDFEKLGFLTERHLFSSYMKNQGEDLKKLEMSVGLEKLLKEGLKILKISSQSLIHRILKRSR